MTPKKIFIASLLIFCCSVAISLLIFGQKKTPYFNFWQNQQAQTDNANSAGSQAQNNQPGQLSTPASIPTPTPTPPQITILFAGDLMFDRHIREHATEKNNDYIFAEIKETLLDNNLVLVNLECPITDNKSRSVGSVVGSTNNFIFTCDTSLAKTLKEHNISIVNLGNNHILNFGQDGLAQTYQNLEANNIRYFGNVGRDDDKRVTIVEIKGMRIGFVNYNQFINNNLDFALADIKETRPKADILIMYPHWGNEYMTTANLTIQNLAHQFIDEGADLVMGSHPHVVQQSEVYKNKTIYYSLGNFIFDQYFEENVKNGLLVKVTINTETGEMSFEEIPIMMEKTGQTILIN